MTTTNSKFSDILNTNWLEIRQKDSNLPTAEETERLPGPSSETPSETETQRKRQHVEVKRIYSQPSITFPLHVTTESRHSCRLKTFPQHWMLVIQIHAGCTNNSWTLPGGGAALSTTWTGGCCYLEAGELLLLSQSLFDQNTFDALLHRILFCLRTGNNQSQNRTSFDSHTIKFLSHFTDLHHFFKPKLPSNLLVYLTLTLLSWSITPPLLHCELLADLHFHQD